MEQWILLGKCLTDPIAVRELALLREGTLCICEISAALQTPEKRLQVSLDRLRAAGLVTSERRGRWMSYSLNERRQPLLKTLLEDMQENLSWDREVTLAKKRLALVLKRRVDGWCPAGAEA